MKEEFNVYVLIRSSKKTGKVDTVMTAINEPMLKLWGLQNTTKTKISIIFERNTGDIAHIYKGSDGGFPKATSSKAKGDMGNITEFIDIPMEGLRDAFYDERFDK